MQNAILRILSLQEKFFVVDVPSDTANPLLSFTLVEAIGYP